MNLLKDEKIHLYDTEVENTFQSHSNKTVLEEIGFKSLGRRAAGSLQLPREGESLFYGKLTTDFFLSCIPVDGHTSTSIVALIGLGGC